MPKKLIKSIALFWFCLFFAFFCLTVFAQERMLEVDYPEILGINLETVNTQIGEYINYIFYLSVVISGFFLFGIMVYGGIKYILSGDNLPALIDARQQILAGFLGILIILSGYIILSTINPHLVIIELPDPRPPLSIERSQVDPLEAETLISSIDAELPLGRIIWDRIFPNQRLNKIEENTSKTLDITDQLIENNENLRNIIDFCDCGKTTCVCSCSPPSCAVSDDCYCNCDPCVDIRGEIESLQNKSIELLKELKVEQEVTVLEITDLKTQLNILERLEKYFTQDCRLWTLRSLAELTIKIDDFAEKGILRQIKVWDDIDIIYWSDIEKNLIRDWATFYCQIGGTTFFEQQPQPGLEKPDAIVYDVSEIYTHKIESCPTEAPVGEFIDRVKRISKLLIYRMEYFSQLQDKMVEAINEMNKLVNQCSSVNCNPECACIYCTDIDEDGNSYSYCCGCTCDCRGNPCPYEEIDIQLEIIKEIGQEIESITWNQWGVAEKTNEEIGIMSIIKEIVPTIWRDFKTHIWYPMRECVKKGESRVLFDSQRVVGSIDAEGAIIRTPCYQERAYDYCLEECYLKDAHLNIENPDGTYRRCLEECLKEISEEHNLEQIAWCRHLLNFYCCNIKWDYLR